MFTNKKKIALVMAMSLAFTGCGKDKDKNADKDKNVNATITEDLKEDLNKKDKDDKETDKKGDKEEMKKEVTIDDIVEDVDKEEKDINVVEWEDTGNTWETDDFKLEMQNVSESKVSDEEISGVGITRDDYPNLYSIDYAYLVDESLGEDYFLEPVNIKDENGNEGFILFIDQSLEMTGTGVSQKHTTITVGFKEKPSKIDLTFKDDNNVEKVMTVDVN